MRYTDNDIKALEAKYGRQVTAMDYAMQTIGIDYVEKTYDAATSAMVEVNHMKDGRTITRHNGLAGTLYFIKEA